MWHNWLLPGVPPCASLLFFPSASTVLFQSYRFLFHFSFLFPTLLFWFTHHIGSRSRSRSRSRQVDSNCWDETWRQEHYRFRIPSRGSTTTTALWFKMAVVLHVRGLQVMLDTELKLARPTGDGDRLAR